MAQDIQNAAGFALLDPHGDLVKDVLRLIPQARKDDVIYINPSDRAYQPGFNVFEGIGHPGRKTFGCLGAYKRV